VVQTFLSASGTLGAYTPLRRTGRVAPACDYRDLTEHVLASEALASPNGAGHANASPPWNLTASIDHEVTNLAAVVATPLVCAGSIAKLRLQARPSIDGLSRMESSSE